MHSVLTAAILSLMVAMPLSPTGTRPVDGEECPGCVDNSGAPSVTQGCSPRALIGVALSGNSGGCWEIDGECVESFPCTPKLEVSATAFEDAKFKLRGYVGPVGLAGGQYLGPAFTTVAVYSDYTEVGCGDSLSFNVGVNVTFVSDGTECLMSTSGSFDCSQCNF